VNQSEDGQPVLKPTNVLKCSHGGIIDTTSNIPALGGINKDVKTSLLSPHYYHQESAANAAIESTYLFLKKLWHLMETKNDNTSYFGRLLELVSSQRSLIFIIDLTESMRNDIARIKILVREMIINVTSDRTSIPCEIGIVAFEKQTFSMIAKPHIDGEIDRLLNFLNNLTIHGDRKSTMNAIIQGLSLLSNDHCFAYVFTNQLNDDHDRHNEVSVLAKRKHCKINFLVSKDNKADQRMKKIALETSGIQLDLSNDNLFSILQLITHTNSIPILSSSDFYIDSSVEIIQFVINIQPACQFPINFDLKNLFISPDQSKIDFLLNFDSQNIKIGQINQPTIGPWQFRANSSLIESFQIRLITSIHFEHSFQMLRTDLTHPGLYSINTEPIQGSSLYSVIRIISYTSEEIDFDELKFIDSSNNLLKRFNLIKQNDLIYTSKIEIPSRDFYIKIQGKNKKNELIERLYPYEIHPRTL
jgi:acetolactate synthase small subunit